MFVRQLIGREAGNIINMPYSAAQSCLAMGTVEAVTDEDIAAAGLEPAEPLVANRPDELPRGFRVENIPGGGFDLYDPGGVNISRDVDLPNLIAARDLAWSILHPAEAAPDTTALEELTKADLLKMAEAADIELAGNAKKADIIAALVAAGVTTPPDADSHESQGNHEQSGAGNENNSTGEATSEGAADGAAGDGSGDNGSEGQAE
ncbi:Rho termination factor N-terminal domain-containing protein [Rhizobium leguminosarum]|uniref:Rho termination factor N-terminal domain-containing protein n=1 Tax=Rhizobium leguminosarum TaxID=384 RepID=UPI003F98086C